MPKTLSGANTLSPALLALRPRQVALTALDMKQDKPNASLDKKTLLLQSVACFLDHNGFSKTLKKFCSEAKIQIDASKSSLLDLEEVFNKYFDICNDVKTDLKDQKVQEVKVVNLLPEEPENNEKKKKRSSSETESLPSATEEQVKESSLEDKEVTCSRKEKKSKDKKKNKLSTAESLTNDNDSHTVNSSALNAHDTSVKEKSSKSKTKKKKKDDLALESSGVNSKDKNLPSTDANADATGKDDKGSKKRKRLVSEDNDLKPEDKVEVDESKRRKTKDVEDSKGSKELNGHENGNIDESAEKPSMQKTKKKQLNGSAEPKTVNAFQRVKVEEVVFTDERLKDNSYWAKDGADSGYGAKAQEVLGQVRGRDFRHEKTKKKRGSYRGGQIDLYSHSVKFNYSDEE
uniref:Srp40 C-terminal domain-containing protein n=1 Tax=Cannabis sativa TaxID=3483 RepID=A0A803PI82_CANSA